MSRSRLIIALPAALALSAGALAGDDDKMRADSASDSEAVEALKDALPNKLGFEVQDVRPGDDGVTCITYTVVNDLNGESRNRAVVQGDKVLRETTGNTRFARAWNSKCAKAG